MMRTQLRLTGGLKVKLLLDWPCTLQWDKCRDQFLFPLKPVCILLSTPCTVNLILGTTFEPKPQCMKCF